MKEGESENQIPRVTPTSRKNWPGWMNKEMELLDLKKAGTSKKTETSNSATQENGENLDFTAQEYVENKRLYLGYVVINGKKCPAAKDSSGKVQRVNGMQFDRELDTLFWDDYNNEWRT